MLKIGKAYLEIRAEGQELIRRHPASTWYFDPQLPPVRRCARQRRLRYRAMSTLNWTRRSWPSLRKDLSLGSGKGV
jgi:hypothetical protein